MLQNTLQLMHNRQNALTKNLSFIMLMTLALLACCFGWREYKREL
jgi:hypothetical protein